MFVPLQHRSSVSAPRQQCGQHTFQPRCPIISTMIINNNNDNNVYGVIIMTKVIAMSSPDSFDECSLVAANPQTKPIDLGCESAENWQLPSTSTIASPLLLLVSLQADRPTHFTVPRRVEG